jgi:hypothetical protein
VSRNSSAPATSSASASAASHPTSAPVKAVDPPGPLFGPTPGPVVFEFGSTLVVLLGDVVLGESVSLAVTLVLGESDPLVLGEPDPLGDTLVLGEPDPLGDTLVLGDGDSVGDGVGDGGTSMHRRFTTHSSALEVSPWAVTTNLMYQP